MKHLILFLLFLVGYACAQAQWVEGNRKQSQPLNGNGALLVYQGTMCLWNEEHHFQLSTDNGETWTDPSDSIGGANPHVTILTAAGGRMYGGLNFGTGDGVPIYSSDMGVTWQPDTAGAPGHALGWGGHPVVSNIFAWGHWVVVAWDQPVPYSIKTFDGEWTQNDYMNNGANRPASFAAKGDTLFCAGSKIYYTTDGGQTFTEPANNGYSGYGAKLFIDGSRLYMFAFKAWGQPAYLYYSDDNAENWTEVDVSSLTGKKIINGDPYFPTAFFIRGNRIEFAAGMDGFNRPPNVWKSTDLGTTWERDTAGLPSSYVNGANSFAYTPDGTLWCVPSYQNIYKQKIDAGTGDTKQVTASPVLYAPGQGGQSNLPARFVWGSVANAASYQLQIATDTAFALIVGGSDGMFRQAAGAAASFATVVLDESGIVDTSFSVVSLPAAERYYWRVRGIGEGEQAGPWSDAAEFMLSTAGVDVEADGQLWIGPNPCVDHLAVQFPKGEIVSLELRDLLGRVVQVERDLNGRTFASLDVRGLPAGSYWLVAKRASGVPVVSPLVVK